MITIKILRNEKIICQYMDLSKMKFHIEHIVQEKELIDSGKRVDDYDLIFMVCR